MALVLGMITLVNPNLLNEDEENESVEWMTVISTETTNILKGYSGEILIQDEDEEKFLKDIKKDYNIKLKTKEKFIKDKKKADPETLNQVQKAMKIIEV